MKNNYFENSTHKSQQPIMSTPCKNDKYDMSDDYQLNSNRKAEDFLSYCQNNLSPINNIPYMGKSHFMASPLQPNQKNYKNMKSTMSPQISYPGQYNRYTPMGYNGVHMMPPIHNGEYISIGKDDFEMDYHQQYIPKSAITPVINKHAQPVLMLNGKPSNYPSSKPSHFSNQYAMEQSSNYYVYQSPVFKMTFNSKNQFEKFIDSDFNKVYVDDFQIQSCGAKSVVPKSSEYEYENGIIPYKRVIKFNDENDEEYVQGEGTNTSNQDEHNQKKTNSSSSTSSSIMNVKNPLKKGDGQNATTSYNLFEDNNKIQGNMLLDSQNTQVTFNPYLNSQNSQAHDNATTVKKTIDSQISSQDYVQTAQKQQQQQKRKLFESPQFNDDRDMHTPSTKKKSNSLLIGNQVPQFGNAISNKKKEEKIESKKLTKKEKLLQQQAGQSLQLSSNKAESNNLEEENARIPPIEKSTAEKEDEHEDIDEEEVDRDEKSSHSSENSHNHHHHRFAAQDSSAKPALPSEERKICCNCKRTKCLKLYCECFAASRICEGCTCQGCFNKPEYESMRQEARQAILERNNSAFDPKIDSQAKLKQLCNEDGVDVEQKVHSKGCNCKKSNCLKKYCECYQLGVKCTKLCKCDNCKNNSSHSGNNFEEPESRINATPSASNVLASSGKMTANRSSANQVNSLISNEYSQYNQYNYYYNQEYQPFYYPYGGYYYYGEYYPYNGEEQPGENSAAATAGVPPPPPPPHPYGHPDQYPYENYGHPSTMPSSQYKENGRSMKKYPPQYSQMHPYNMQYEGQPLQSRGKKGQKGGNPTEESYGYSYPFAANPEKKRKYGNQEESKNLFDQSQNKETNDDQSYNKENLTSPRFKEVSNEILEEQQQTIVKKEEQLGHKKEQRKSKQESDNLQKKDKKEEFSVAEVDNTAEQQLHELQQQQQNDMEVEEEEDIQEDIEELENNEANSQGENENNEEEQEVNPKLSKTKRTAKKEDKKRKLPKKEVANQNTEITKSPHNTRKNQKESYLKFAEDNQRLSSTSKSSTKKATAKKNDKKEKKEALQDDIEEKQPSTSSKRSNSKRQKNSSS